MEYLLYSGLGWFGTLALVVAVVVLFVKIRNLKGRIRNLENRKFTENNTERNFSVSSALENSAEVLENKNREVPRYVVGNETVAKNVSSNIVEKNHEYNIGSKIIPAIGIISVLFGVGFFLKYTFDHNLIDETGRVILGFALGVSFVAVGERLRSRFAGYSALLMGGGFAILYLAAKFGMIYDLYSNAVGFILMTVITIAAVLIAFKTNSRIIAFVALIGGFLNPFLAASGQANEIVLFNYILLLLAGMIFLAWKKGWMGLIVGSAVGTIILYAGSFEQYYANSEFGIYWAYLIIFFAVFTITPFLLYFAKKSKYQIFNYGNLILPVVAGGIFMTISYYIFDKMAMGEWDYSNVASAIDYKGPKRVGVVVPVFENLYFIIGLIPAVLYLALSKISIKRFREFGDAKPVYFFIAMAAFAIALIPALQFSGKWITFAWLIEALALAMIAFKTKTKVFFNIAAVVVVAGVFRLFTVDERLRVIEYLGSLEEYVISFSPIINERALIYFIGAGVTFTMAYIGVKNGRKTLAKILGITGNIIALSWILMELDSAAAARYISHDMSSLLLSVAYMVYASVMMWIGIIKNYVGFRIFAIVLFGLVVLKAYFVDIWNLSEILRILAFIVLGLVTLGVGYYYTKNSEKIKTFLKD